MVCLEGVGVRGFCFGHCKSEMSVGHLSGEVK